MLAIAFYPRHSRPSTHPMSTHTKPCLQLRNARLDVPESRPQRRFQQRQCHHFSLSHSLHSRFRPLRRRDRPRHLALHVIDGGTQRGAQRHAFLLRRRNPPPFLRRTLLHRFDRSKRLPQRTRRVCQTCLQRPARFRQCRVRRRRITLPRRCPVAGGTMGSHLAV